MRSASPPVHRHAKQCPNSWSSTTTNRLDIASAMYAMPALDLGIDHSSITPM